MFVSVVMLHACVVGNLSYSVTLHNPLKRDFPELYNYVRL